MISQKFLQKKKQYNYSMWLLTSVTFYFNAALILVGCFAPHLDLSIRKILVLTGVTNLSLRIKTQWKLEKDN